MVRDWGGWMEEMVFYGVIIPFSPSFGADLEIQGD
jgi:hypothetical protein